MKETKKQRPFAVDREKRNKRRRALRHVEQNHLMISADGSELESKREFETCPEYAEERQIVGELAAAFINSKELEVTHLR
jgi:hypothetical protein